MGTEPFNPNSTVEIKRTDAGSRKIIDRLDIMRGEIEDLRVDAAKSVKWDKLVVMLGAAAATIVSGAWAVIKLSEARSDRYQAEQIRQLREDMASLRGAVPKVEAYARGSYQVQVEKRPAAAVVKEVREATADGGTR